MDTLHFSQHAKERMAQRKISEALVKHCLTKGKHKRDGDAFIFALPLSADGIEVDASLIVITTSTGSVITTYVKKN